MNRRYKVEVRKLAIFITGPTSPIPMKLRDLEEALNLEMLLHKAIEELKHELNATIERR